MSRIIQHGLNTEKQLFFPVGIDDIFEHTINHRDPQDNHEPKLPAE